MKSGEPADSSCAKMRSIASPSRFDMASSSASMRRGFPDATNCLGSCECMKRTAVTVATCKRFPSSDIKPDLPIPGSPRTTVALGDVPSWLSLTKRLVPSLAWIRSLRGILTGDSWVKGHVLPSFGGARWPSAGLVLELSQRHSGNTNRLTRSRSFRPVPVFIYQPGVPSAHVRCCIDDQADAISTSLTTVRFGLGCGTLNHQDAETLPLYERSRARFRPPQPLLALLLVGQHRDEVRCALPESSWPRSPEPTPAFLGHLVIAAHRAECYQRIAADRFELRLCENAPPVRRSAQLRRCARNL